MQSNKPRGDQEHPYETPAIVDHGTLLELTLAGGLPNSDVPNGTPGTAFPPS